MEYISHFLLFLTLCLSFFKVTSGENALKSRSSMYHGCKVFTARITSKKDVEILKNLHKQYKDGVQLWVDSFEKNDLVYFHVKRQYVNRVYNVLNRHGLEFKMLKSDVEQTIRKEINRLRDSKYEEFGYNYAKHNPFNAMISLLKGLTNKYRRISKLESAGYTIERRPILAVHISKTRFNRNPVIFIECGAHAREWSAFEVCIYFISNLLKQRSEKVKKITSKYDFVIIPALNPDGYVYTWTKDRMWRKNRSCDLPREKCVGGCVGVDVNRNFDVNFCSDKMSSKQPCSETYCGKQAFSEKESLAVRDLMGKLGNRLFGYFCFHAVMGVWAFPWAKTKQLPSNHRELERVAKVAVTTLQKGFNSTYKTGTIANVIYGVTGSSMDYGFDVGHAKYAYVIELRGGKKDNTGFIMGEEEILPLCKETFAALVNSVLAMRPVRRQMNGK